MATGMWQYVGELVAVEVLLVCDVIVGPGPTAGERLC